MRCAIVGALNVTGTRVGDRRKRSSEVCGGPRGVVTHNGRQGAALCLSRVRRAWAVIQVLKATQEMHNRADEGKCAKQVAQPNANGSTASRSAFTASFPEWQKLARAGVDRVARSGAQVQRPRRIARGRFTR